MILVSEVGPRDGVQSLDAVLPLELKKRWIAAEAAAGVREIEVGSFVNYKMLPQMADTAELVAFARGLPDLNVAVLVPNLRGAQAAIAAGAHKISIPVSASETHSLRNVNRSHSQMLDEVSSIRGEIDALPEADRPYFEAGIATAFGCTIEGNVPESTIVRLAEELIAAGAQEIGLSDTTGYADPAMIRSRIKAVHRAVGSDRLTGVHLHNTRGLGLANALAALDCGMTTLDSSLGGLGGCPYAPGASGNIVTEDLVFMLERMGYDTGVDLEKLLKVRETLERDLADGPIFGFLAEAGLPLGWAKTKGRK
ncbi:hydroxymethylglutaryl-CoA lyase [Sulfitobacter geojensis]|uniref:hydroxymethylglutaryl-CoA lyase n=1 Tax=Sulfitobacter geojensis TaxID=1342299 RepID=UPI000469E5FC|nr:hydroxymethylglutaryl-CoA lyase [Sulfitobacter geojensis]KHA51335.1 Hydroxymethylglutaryl-CoA lyase [Sulfitobacter geojensis]NYI30258.1 hydroxymethylglutaryl-CoA lyase [Sulfitobacter geojensis]